MHVPVNRGWNFRGGRGVTRAHGPRIGLGVRTHSYVFERGLIVRRFSLLLAAASFVLSVTASAAVADVAPSAKKTVVESCLKNYTLHAALDAAELHSHGRPDAKPENVNDIPLTISTSSSSSNTVSCYYKSAKGDIVNLAYGFPCNQPRKANNGYEEAWLCNP